MVVLLLCYSYYLSRADISLLFKFTIIFAIIFRKIGTFELRYCIFPFMVVYILSRFLSSLGIVIYLSTPKRINIGKYQRNISNVVNRSSQDSNRNRRIIRSISRSKFVQRESQLYKRFTKCNDTFLSIYADVIHDLIDCNQLFADL